CFPLQTVAFRGHFPKDMPFNYRKWNILAFRGRLMSLLAPARGMSTLPAKGGFSRPSSLRTPGSHLGLISPRRLAYSICWDRLSFTASFLIRVNSINALTYSKSGALHR